MRLPRLAACAALIAAAWSAPPAHAELRLRVMTYNVHWAVGVSAATGRSTGRVELAPVIRDIRRSGAQVVSLQEAQSYRFGDGTTFSEPRELAKALGWTAGGVGRHYFFRGGVPIAKWCRRLSDGRAVVRRIGRRRARCVRHGEALLSRHRLAGKRSFSLYRADGDAADGDALGTHEGRVLVRARIRLAGVRLWLFSAHLAREAPVASCQLATALRRAGLGRPALLLADLNMTSMTRAEPNCPEAPERPFDLLREARFHERRPVPFSYPAYAPVRPADHVLVRGASVLSTRTLRNCRPRRAGGARVCSSDHRPLLARLVIRP
ncbi:MAG: endonuclease/exonuclease/phosphatase family protein [Thermoleophilaceae bacterium]